MTPQQHQLLAGVSAFSALIGDILSSKIYDCTSLINQSTLYTRIIKKTTNLLERQRINYEYQQKQTIIDINTFADKAQELEDEVATRFQQIQACVCLALGAHKHPHHRHIVTLITTLSYAEVVTHICHTMLQVLQQHHIAAIAYRADPSRLMPPLRNLTLHILTPPHQHLLQKCHDNPTLIRTIETLAEDLIRKALPQAITDHTDNAENLKDQRP